jgi:putative glutamine amidotransferase
MKTIYLWGDAARFANYCRAVEEAGGSVRFTNPEICDALLLPGGADLAPWRYGQANTASRGIDTLRDTEELELLQRFVLLKKPVLGICRGLQVINVYFGGTLLQDIAGHSAANGIDRRHRVQSVPSPLREICGEYGIVNSAHHQAVNRLGHGLSPLQWSPDGIIEALEHHALPVWGVQWHPERMESAVRQQLFRWFLSLES